MQLMLFDLLIGAPVFAKAPIDSSPAPGMLKPEMRVVAYDQETEWILNKHSPSLRLFKPSPSSEQLSPVSLSTPHPNFHPFSSTNWCYSLLFGTGLSWRSPFS